MITTTRVMLTRTRVMLTRIRVMITTTRVILTPHPLSTQLSWSTQDKQAECPPLDQPLRLCNELLLMKMVMLLMAWWCYRWQSKDNYDNNSTCPRAPAQVAQCPWQQLGTSPPSESVAPGFSFWHFQKEFGYQSKTLAMLAMLVPLPQMVGSSCQACG